MISREHLVVGDGVDAADAAHLPVAQDRHPVGDDADLGEAMGDVDDRRPGGGHAADVPEQHLDRFLVERRRRLVENEHAGIDGERLGELEEVLVDDRQGVDAIFEVRSEADVVEDSAHCRPGRRPAGATMLGRATWTFSATVKSGSSAGCWWTMAMPSWAAVAGVRRSTSAPSTSIVPLSGATVPEATFISVDLPAPFSPRRAWTSPAATSSVTSVRARTGP